MPMEAILFVVFVGLVVINVPIGVAPGLSEIDSKKKKKERRYVENKNII